GEGIKTSFRVYTFTLSPEKPKDIPENYLKRFTKEIVKDAKNCLREYEEANKISETLAKEKYPTTFTFNLNEDPTVKKMLEESFLNYQNELEEKLRLATGSCSEWKDPICVYIKKKTKKLIEAADRFKITE
ncbi:MAG: hypothetical protein KAU95_02890, partial [Candidatus Aenigmarchaeota archaeon]|nr:hypothetical protein [Candidatus Aenigmarchaeota archaeon]